MKALVYVTLKSGVLDPQGQAVAHALQRLGFAEVAGVRVGRYVEIEIEPGASQETTEEIRARVSEMSQKLLANPVIEDFRVEVEPAPRRPGGAP